MPDIATTVPCSGFPVASSSSTPEMLLTCASTKSMFAAAAGAVTVTGVAPEPGADGSQALQGMLS